MIKQQSKYFKNIKLKEIKINGNYHEIMPRPTIAEREILKKDIEDSGIKMPLQLNQNYELIDGHTRFYIAQELGIKVVPAIIKEYKDDAEEAEDVVTLNLKRRQLNTAQKIEIGMRLAENERKKALERRLANLKQNNKKTSGQNVGLRNEKGRTINIIAEKIVVSHNTLEKGWEILKAAKEDTEIAKEWAKALAGELSVDFIYKELKRKQKRKESQHVSTTSEKNIINYVPIVKLEEINHIEPNSIYNGDAAEVLKKFPENYVDCVVTSPPYDEMRTYDGNVLSFEKTSQIIKQLYKVMKPGGVVVWVVGDKVERGSLTDTSYKQLAYFVESGFIHTQTIYYIKNSVAHPASSGGRRYTEVVEQCYILSKDEVPKTFNQICDKKNRWAGKRGFGQATQYNTDGVLESYQRKTTSDTSPRTNTWYYFVGGGYSSIEKVEHPSIMPYLLAFDMIRTYSNEGDIILDPFAGGGTTLLMAQKLNRKFIGVEISEKYCSVTANRFNFANLYNVEKMIEQSARQYNALHIADEENEEEENNSDNDIILKKSISGQGG